jgi:hypothetical protein
MHYVICALFGAMKPQLKKRKAFRPFSIRTAPAIHRHSLFYPVLPEKKKTTSEKRKGFRRFAGSVAYLSLAVPKACAVLRVIDCLLFLQENRLNAGSFEDFPAVTVRFDFSCEITLVPYRRNHE